MDERKKIIQQLAKEEAEAERANPHDDGIYCDQCGRLIEPGEEYIILEGRIICDCCEFDFLQPHRKWAE